ncbi:MAG TPA: glycosyl hydrolase family 65 protein [Acidimicrobiia bacterium]|nr:glycosyl hydrolase family 65 protein [Acidimicrobiia bacterium]
MNPWLWSYHGYEPDEEGVREALCALGNGYLATRGALPESHADGAHYPGTYIAGVFNRLRATVEGQTVENESLVNAPNWLAFTLTGPDGTTFECGTTEVLDHELELDLRRSLLTRRSRLRDANGRVLSITQRRFVSLRDSHLAALETTLVAENWSGRLRVESALDGRVTNSGVRRYAALGTDHLVGQVARQISDDAVALDVQTVDSHVRIAMAARTTVDVPTVMVDRDVVTDDRYVAHVLDLELQEGAPVVVDKIVAIYTSRDDGIYEPLSESEDAVCHAPSFDDLLERHVVSWNHAWERGRIDITDGQGHTGRVLNLHIFHMLQTTSKNTAELDVGVPARGLHGEAYRGHIFWDELFIFPFLNWRVPELSRALLRYRSRRLDRARRNAAEAGYRGALYPWQSASSGREETQTLHLNPKSGRWLPDASHLQHHINGAVAYNVWQYWQVTADIEFMRFWGTEMLLEIARFWSSMATYNHTLDRYEIKGVMGPDEYHEAYPHADTPGLNNNAYTNVLAVWCLIRAFDALALLPESRRRQLREKLVLTSEELDRWGDVSRKMRLCFHDGVLSQFEGYDQLEELDWEDYRARYGNIQRLDRILESEGLSTNNYKLAKQADTLMLFYLFSEKELSQLIERLGYEYPPDFLRRHLEYYEPRTSHGSTLSQTVASFVFSRIDRERSWDLFREALQSDVTDSQGGTTAEGIHLGAMAGTVDLVQRCYTGIETRDDILRLDPVLPVELGSLSFDVRYRGHAMHLEFTADYVRIKSEREGAAVDVPMPVDVCGTIYEIIPGATLEVKLG